MNFGCSCLQSLNLKVVFETIHMRANNAEDLEIISGFRDQSRSLKNSSTFKRDLAASKYQLKLLCYVAVKISPTASKT